MKVRVMNFATISKALIKMLEEDEYVGGADVTIERSAEPNEDLVENGWVGVFRADQNFTPHTIGTGHQGMFQQEPRLVLILQVSDTTNPQDCEDKLESLVENVVNVVLNDVTLRGTVGTITNVSVATTDYQKVGSGDDVDPFYIQKAVMYITSLTLVTAIE